MITRSGGFWNAGLKKGTQIMKALGFVLIAVTLVGVVLTIVQTATQDWTNSLLSLGGWLCVVGAVACVAWAAAEDRAASRTR